MENVNESGMQDDPFQDVPSRIDVRRIEDARQWADEAMVKRPWRMEFFRQIIAALVKAGLANGSVLELGAGPGFLAHHIKRVSRGLVAAGKPTA
jgi:hypothetical protein